MIAAVHARVLIVMLGVLTLATSASAECARVLWQRVDTFDSRGALVVSPTDVGATYTTAAECITAIDGLERRRQSPQSVLMRDAPTRLIVMFRDNNQAITTPLPFLCAPDTVDRVGRRANSHARAHPDQHGEEVSRVRVCQHP